MAMTGNERNSSAVVQIVGPADRWILEKLARTLAAKLPYAEFVPWKPQPTATTRIAYYFNYALYQGPSGLIDVGFFTHEDPAHQFLERARQMDLCISKSQKYADWLRGQGVQHVVTFPMGFDTLRYRPRLVLGVVGRLDHPRKGKHLVDRLQTLPFVEIVTTEGKLSETQLRDVYQQVDYVLIPATVEGGPMCLLEGLGMGKPVIAPDGVGMMQEFPQSEHIQRYPVGDGDALERVVRQCFERKCGPAKLVQARTWANWAASHHQVFGELLKSRGHIPPSPAPGFRFGLLDDLELPWDIDLEPLESAVDHVASELFFGRNGQARAILEKLLPDYPSVEKLLATLPSGDVLAATQEPTAKSDVPRIDPISGQREPTISVSNPQQRSTEDPWPRILLIAHVETLRERMDKSHYYRYQALSRRSGVTLFGPGIPGYQTGMSVEAAIRIACHGITPHVVVHGGDLRDSGIPLVTGLESTKLLTAIELLDTWANPERSVQFITRQGFKVALMQEAGPHLEYYRRYCPRTEFFWTPNGVNTSLFHDYGLPKIYDVIFYGVLDEAIYPFLTRLAKLLPKATGLRVRSIRHPGYYPHLEGTSEPIAAGADLGRAINQSWIGIATRSAYQCLLMKHLEIAASCAAIVGTVPEWHEPLFAGGYIQLREDQSDDAILASIRSHLADKDRLREMTKRTHRKVLRDFSTEAFADLVVGIFREVLGRT